MNLEQPEFKLSIRLRADKADIADIFMKKGVELLTPLRSNMKVRLPAPHHSIGKRWRKLIETVGSHLTERWHYQNCLIRKVLSHTICIFINLQLGRPPLHLDDLVAH
jgi:hypothetical protein